MMATRAAGHHRCAVCCSARSASRRWPPCWSRCSTPGACRRPGCTRWRWWSRCSWWSRRTSRSARWCRRTSRWPGPERTAIALAPPLRIIAKVLGPVVRSLNHLANWTVRRTGLEPRDEVASAFNREEVAGLVAESKDEGLLDPEDHTLIASALQFDTGEVTSVAGARRPGRRGAEGVTAAEVERACARTGFSRFPVAGSRRARYLGYLHIRDVVDIPVADRDLPGAGRTGPAAADAARGDRSAVGAGPDAPRRRAPRPGVASARSGRRSGPAGTLADDDTRADRRLGLVMLEDVIEQLIGDIRDATRREPEPPTAVE